MSKVYLIALTLLPIFSHATGIPGSECAAPGHYVEGMLLASIKNDLDIDITSIQYEKTLVEVLSVEPVSKLMARKMAIADSTADMKKSEDIHLSENEYYCIYHDNHVVNVTAKYTFTDKSNHRDIFISSALANDDECSVKYNGYLTLAREF
jgi:hypothetical protein